MTAGAPWIRCGVELEFVAPYPDEIPARLPESWSYDHYDVEAISPVFESRAEAEAEITGVCTLLTGMGAEAFNRYQGLHVHLSREDLGPAGVKRLLTRYYAELPTLNERWPDRQRMLWPACELLTTGKVCDSHRPACGPHRTLPTLEVRQHPSTLDPAVVLAWLEELMDWARP